MLVTWPCCMYSAFMGSISIFDSGTPCSSFRLDFFTCLLVAGSVILGKKKGRLNGYVSSGGCVLELEIDFQPSKKPNVTRNSMGSLPAHCKS